MSTCLECQRWRKRCEELEKEYLIAKNQWLMLKRFIVELEGAYRKENASLKTGE